MTIRLADDVTIPACDAIVDQVDAGASFGKLKIYSGAQVADPDASSPAGLLATILFQDPAFDPAAEVGANADAAAVTPLTDETNASAGTAASFEITDSDDNVKWTGTVTATAGGGDIELSTTTIAAGGTVSITSLVFRMKRDP